MDDIKKTDEYFTASMTRSELPWLILATQTQQENQRLAIEPKQSAESQSSTNSQSKKAFFQPMQIWKELSIFVPRFVQCVCAFISLGASEAAVERTFSLQKLTHSVIQNRLQELSVENEMFLKLVARSIRQGGELVDQSIVFGAWIDLGTVLENDTNDDESGEQNDTDADVDVEQLLIGTSCNA